MSKENSKTLEVYDRKAKQYLENTLNHNNDDLEKAKRKEDELHNFFLECLSDIPKGSRGLEIGSADGENAKFIKDSGYDILASDVAEGFLDAIKELGLDPIKFNALEDELKEKYYFVLCWRVLVHFTLDDTRTLLNKIYEALEDNGVFIFNVRNSKVEGKVEEWVDLKEYPFGEDRYYRYYTEEELNEMISETNFKVKHFHTEGGKTNNKWLVYVLKK